jgi:hypothetical protein
MKICDYILLIGDETNAFVCIPLQIPAEQSLGEGTVFDKTVHLLFA